MLFVRFGEMLSGFVPITRLIVDIPKLCVVLAYRNYFVLQVSGRECTCSVCVCVRLRVYVRVYGDLFATTTITEQQQQQ